MQGRDSYTLINIHESLWLGGADSCLYAQTAYVFCGSPEGRCDQRLNLRSPFYVYLTRDFKKFCTVPCHVDSSFNNNTGNMISVQTPDGHEYDFGIKQKTSHPTRLYGSEYKSFIADFGMREGEKIMFNMYNQRYVMPIWPQGANNEPKIQLRDEDSIPPYLVPSGHDVELNEIQSNRYNNIMSTFGPVDGTYLHVLSSSDIDRNYLRVPKSLAEGMNMGNSGDAFFSMDGGVIVHAEYAQCADGRIRFPSGWDSFASSNNLAAGMVVLMIFTRSSNAQSVNIKFHVI